MIRPIALCLAMLLAAPAAAQTDAAAAPDGPILETELNEAATVPGRAVVLRLTVLVPTFLPQPPDWPRFETPDLLVRLPERASGPTSRRIGGATWAGVTRAYRLHPLVPGTLTIPPQSVRVTYAGEAGEPVEATLRTDPVTLSVAVPEGAEDLDPFLAAESLELTQTLEGDPGAMTPGDGVVRTVTARIVGAPAMTLPPLIVPAPVEGIAAYPDEPKLTQGESRGVLSGARTERVSYVAEGGGAGEIPPVELRWWNLSENRVETATAEGFAIRVDGPPAAAAEPRDWRRVALVVAAAALALAAAAALVRAVRPRFARWRARRRAERLASEAHAWRALRAALAARDHAALRPALDLWAARTAGPDPRDRPDVQAALTALGAARYGPRPGDAAAAWRTLDAALAEARRPPRAEAAGALPPLNPVPRAGG